MYLNQIYTYKNRNSNFLIFSLVKKFFCGFLIAFTMPSYAELINTFTDGKQRVWVDTTSKEGTGNIRRIMELVNYKN